LPGNASIDLREAAERVDAEPLIAPTSELDNLLSRITGKNIHPEVNFGELVGDEIL
jgi:hypothetical protein